MGHINHRTKERDGEIVTTNLIRILKTIYITTVQYVLFSSLSLSPSFSPSHIFKEFVGIHLHLSLTIFFLSPLMSAHTATQKLVVTLRRGLAGKRNTIKLTCKALGLTKPRVTRIVPNTSTFRGQIEKIKHLVKVETEVAFKKRTERKEKKFSLRPEIVVEH